MSRVTRHLRLLTLGGVVGPVAFVGAWALAGTSTPGYSPVNRAISDLAAVGAPTRIAMTLGFMVFGLGLIAFALALREELRGRAWIAALVTGASTIGVAVFPLGGWAGDNVHLAFASVGYVAIVSLPLLAATDVPRLGRLDWGRVSVLCAAVSAACLLASTLGPVHGLWQRLGLTISDAWIVITASHLIATGGSASKSQRT